MYIAEVNINTGTDIYKKGDYIKDISTEEAIRLLNIGALKVIYGNETDVSEQEEIDILELKKKTKAELIQIAKEQEIFVSEDMTKNDIIENIIG